MAGAGSFSDKSTINNKCMNISINAFEKLSGKLT